MSNIEIISSPNVSEKIIIVSLFQPLWNVKVAIGLDATLSLNSWAQFSKFLQCGIKSQQLLASALLFVARGEWEILPGWCFKCVCNCARKSHWKQWKITSGRRSLPPPPPQMAKSIKNGQQNVMRTHVSERGSSNADGNSSAQIMIRSIIWNARSNQSHEQSDIFHGQPCVFHFIQLIRMFVTRPVIRKQNPFIRFLMCAHISAYSFDPSALRKRDFVLICRDNGAADDFKSRLASQNFHPACDITSDAHTELCEFNAPNTNAWREWNQIAN